MDDDQKDEALLRAAAEGQIKRVAFLIRIGSDIDYVGENGLTALHHAALSGFQDTVRALLEAGANVNSVSESHGTPSCLAALKGRHAVVELLLEYRAHVNVTSPGRGLGTALHAATLSADPATVKAVLDAGANVNAQATGSPKLIWALKSGDSMDESTAALSIDSPVGFVSSVDRFELSSRQTSSYAPEFANEDLHKKLNTARDLDPELKQMRLQCAPIFTACWTQSLAIVDLLLKSGANVNAEYRSGIDGSGLPSDSVTTTSWSDSGKGCLRIAVAHSRPELLTRLINGGANVDEDVVGKPILFVALKQERLDLVRQLAQHGSNLLRVFEFIRIDESWLLMMDHLKDALIVHWQIDALEYEWKSTLLPVAAAYGDLRVVEWLLAHGAASNYNGYNESLHSSLTLAVSAGHSDVVAVHRHYGASSNTKYLSELNKQLSETTEMLESENPSMKVTESSKIPVLDQATSSSSPVIGGHESSTAQPLPVPVLRENPASDSDLEDDAQFQAGHTNPKSYSGTY